jgi:hypothetical protein
MQIVLAPGALRVDSVRASALSATCAIPCDAWTPVRSAPRLHGNPNAKIMPLRFRAQFRLFVPGVRAWCSCRHGTERGAQGLSSSFNMNCTQIKSSCSLDPGTPSLRRRTTPVELVTRRYHLAEEVNPIPSADPRTATARDGEPAFSLRPSPRGRCQRDTRTTTSNRKWRGLCKEQ